MVLDVGTVVLECWYSGTDVDTVVLDVVQW